MLEQKELPIKPDPEIYVFDMDGTLYKLDGEGGSINGSTLMSQVLNNSARFVAEKEKCGLFKAKQIIQNAIKDRIGISRVLSEKYGITRSEVFEKTWNVDPKYIIKKSVEAINAITLLKQSGKRLFLLTSAPKIWMENVLSELNLYGIFERKISGEYFEKKDEIFCSLAQEFDPSLIISIGDQVETDILPARRSGINTFFVTNPSDLLKLI